MDRQTQTVELRSWALIVISFLLGMVVSEFVDNQWETTVDSSTSLVAGS